MRNLVVLVCIALQNRLTSSCAAAMRSTAIALLSVAINEGLTPEQTLNKAKNLGFGFFKHAGVSPRLKQLFINYLHKHQKVAVPYALTV